MASPAPNLQGGEPKDANAEEAERFLTSAEEDGPFYMVNLIRYRDRAEYPDGRTTDLTGQEADAIYGSFMRSTKLPEIGARVIYVGQVERDIISDSGFDVVAVVEYPSRARFVQMTQDPAFQEMSIHKQAGVADTVVLATSPIELPEIPLPANPPFPATAADQPFTFMHVLDYRETAEYQPGDADADDTRPGKTAVDLYSANAGSVAAPLGVIPVAWFQVEATLIGPPNTWDEVRINLFPSHATFNALTSDSTWQAGSHHRTAGLNNTYAIMNLPRVNEINGVIANGG